MVFVDQQRIRALYDLDWFNHLFKLAGTKMNGYRFIFSEKGIVQNIIFFVWGSVFFHFSNSRRNKKNQAAERRLGNPDVKHALRFSGFTEINILSKEILPKGASSSLMHSRL